MFLGNDLVHWGGAAAREKETRSRRTHRFIDRVLHEREHPFLERRGATPISRAQTLWALWAAKEAAFKAAVKALPGLPFSPRSIRVEFLSTSADRTGPWPLPHTPIADDLTRPLAYGVAHVRAQVYEILWESHAEFVHALAIGPLPAPRRPAGPPLFGDHWQSVVRKLTQIPASAASESVRRVALQLYALIGGETSNTSPVQIVRRLLTTGRLGPPRFCGGTLREDLDLTLTHDGPWGAAAILSRSPAAISER